MSILRTSCKGRLRVFRKGADYRDFPITSFTESFALNEIPQCPLQIGLGSSVFLNENSGPVDEEAMSYLQEQNIAMWSIRHG